MSGGGPSRWGFRPPPPPSGRQGESRVHRKLRAVGQALGLIYHDDGTWRPFMLRQRFRPVGPAPDELGPRGVHSPAPGEVPETITFTFDGQLFGVSPAAYETGLIVLPDGRVIVPSQWLESFPPIPVFDSSCVVEGLLARHVD
jgi:hypothetical protein